MIYNMNEIEYQELQKLISACQIELKNYVEAYEDGSFSSSTMKTLKVLKKLEESVIKGEEIEIYILRGVKSISTSAVKEYDGTELETAILNITRFMMNNIIQFNQIEPLRSDFDNYFS